MATDYMNLGLDELAREPGERTFETRPASSTHFMPILWTRMGESGKAENLLEWNAETTGASAPGAVVLVASIYAGELGRYDRAKQHYDAALASHDLRKVCRGDDDCVAWNALLLVSVERSLGNEDAAADWLEVAEAAMEPDQAHTPEDATDENPSLLDASFRITKGRYAEAAELLREIAFGRRSDNADYLALPIYSLESGAVFDPLREMPEFQQLLDDYNAWLEPMRQRVLEAQRSGDWEALRQRTYQWAHQSAGESASDS
jgi:tetratricopeptide (TPR) repeat protein